MRRQHVAELHRAEPGEPVPSGQDVTETFQHSAEPRDGGRYKEADQTPAPFLSRPHVTADIMVAHALDATARRWCKDIVIVNGKNIFAHDVEAAVSRVEGVKPGRCAAFGIYSERAGSELLVVMAERLGERDGDTESIRLINHAVVEEIGLPCSDIRMVEPGWLVKTTSGKMSRSENALRYRDLRQAALPG